MLYVLPWGLFGPKEQGFFNKIISHSFKEIYFDNSWSPIYFSFQVPLVCNLNPRKTKICLFYTSKRKAFERIGPHNENILSLIVGSLQGNGLGEKRNNATRFHIYVAAKNVEYIMWFHKIISINGYCNTNKPKIIKILGKSNKIYYSIKFRTWSFSSQNYIYDEFYNSNIKFIPTYEFLLLHLTPLALAIWIMNDGSKDGSGFRISTNCFKKDEIERQQKVLLDRYNLFCKLRHQKELFILYFPLNDMNLLASIIKPSILPCMLYKLG